ncbi:MAG: type transport system ATP-binding protein, partial [Actinomycetota bacterium]|nr:type transport system ATP-binding protein [Actinomycetota bacterium]
GKRLNPRWNGKAARERLERLGIDLARKTGSLSGGQRAQVALALAVAKQPDLLLLDEPLASLDPLARRRPDHPARRAHGSLDPAPDLVEPSGRRRPPAQTCT